MIYTIVDAVFLKQLAGGCKCHCKTFCSVTQAVPGGFYHGWEKCGEVYVGEAVSSEECNTACKAHNPNVNEMGSYPNIDRTGKHYMTKCI